MWVRRWWEVLNQQKNSDDDNYARKAAIERLKYLEDRCGALHLSSRLEDLSQQEAESRITRLEERLKKWRS